MSGFEITYDRCWSDSSIGRAHPAPVTLSPILRSTPVRLVIERRAATRANPLGSVKGIQWLWPTSVLDARGGPPVEPPGAKTLIRALAMTSAEIVVAFARGFDVNAAGENVRKPIWQETLVPPTEEDAGRKKRTKVGEHDPEPVDSITVAGIWRDGHVTAFVEGWWLDAAPEPGRIWTGGHMDYLGWTPFMARVKEIIEERDGGRLL